MKKRSFFQVIINKENLKWISLCCLLLFVIATVSFSQPSVTEKGKHQKGYKEQLESGLLKPKVAICDFHVLGADATFQTDLSDGLYSAFATVTQTERIANAEVRGYLKKHPTAKDTQPFDDTKSLLKLGLHLGATFVVAAKLDALGKTIQVQSNLVHVNSGDVYRSKPISFSNISDANSKMAELVKDLETNINLKITTEKSLLDSYTNLVQNLDKTKELIHSNMQWIKGGNYDQGAEDLSDWETPLHTMYVSDFYLDTFEVSNWEYSTFLSDTKPVADDLLNYINLYDKFTQVTRIFDGFVASTKKSNTLPVVNVSWYGANAYCEWAGKKLPTESQWEYAAGGTNNYDYGYDNAFKSNNYWYNTFELADIRFGKPNSYGLYNMLGNVYEWCSDWFRADYYQISEYKDAVGPKKEDYPEKMYEDNFAVKSLRGGAFNTVEDTELRIERRWWYAPETQYFYVGFRCARS